MNRFNPNTEEDLQCDNCGQPVDSSGSSLDIPDENTKDEDICSVCGGAIMKIVAYSNFDIETVNDYLVADNIKSKEHGENMLKGLKDRTNENDTYYFKLVEDDYKLHKWEP